MFIIDFKFSYDMNEKKKLTILYKSTETECCLCGYLIVLPSISLIGPCMSDSGTLVIWLPYSAAIYIIDWALNARLWHISSVSDQ